MNIEQFALILIRVMHRMVHGTATKSADDHFREFMQEWSPTCSTPPNPTWQQYDRVVSDCTKLRVEVATFSTLREEWHKHFAAKNQIIADCDDEIRIKQREWDTERASLQYRIVELVGLLRSDRC